MTRRNRERAAVLIAAVGALATIATSAPANPTVQARGMVAVGPGTPIHVIVRASRTAVRHADQLEVVVVASGAVLGTVVITPDDSSLTAVTGSTSTTSFATVQALGVAELCPGDEACDIGFDVVVDAASGGFDVDVRASLIAFADERFLFPADRRFPADATIEVVLE